MIEYVHNPTERANITACALGINLNIDYESYGGTESITAMMGEDIVFKGTTSQTVTYLCGLHMKINKILATLSSDGIHHQDKDSSIRSLSETCSPKSLTELYLKWILGNKSIVRYLGDSIF
jgi:hypothetical protein